VRSYLFIQKMRYQDILDFSIDVDEAILGGTILNLTLQPLVENAFITASRTNAVEARSGYEAT